MEGLRAASWYRHATSAEILCVGKKQVVADAEWIRLLALDWIADRVEEGLLVRLGGVEDAGGLGIGDMVFCGSDGQEARPTTHPTTRPTVWGMALGSP